MVLEKVGTTFAKEITAWASGKSLLTMKPVKVNTAGLKLAPQLNTDIVQFSKYSSEDIKAAYNLYAGSPYINEFLRKNEVLTPKSQKLVGCLMQAIETSPPIKGTFVRGITGSKKLNVNDFTIENLIFNNSGFTSTAPMENARYAKTFALGRNSAIVEFELLEPIKAFKPNNYEVIFAPNTFTSDKFNLIKVNDGYYKVVQKVNGIVKNFI